MRRRPKNDGSRLADHPRRITLPTRPPTVPATPPDDQARARLERHLRVVEELPGELARDLAARRAQAWALRERLRKTEKDDQAA